MPLKIRYTNGPFAGRDIDIEDDKAEVKFGRGLDADIPFPEDLTLVSRQHFGLRKEYGGYKFIINQEKPVFMNGRPVLDGQDLPRTAEIQLSGPEGPRLKIERLDGYGSNQMKTEILGSADNVASVLHKGEKRDRTTSRTVGVVAAALIAAAAAGYFLLRGTEEQVAATNAAVQQTNEQVAATQQQIAALKEELPGIKEQLASMGAQTDFTPIIEKVKGSVYQVAIELPSGTLEAMGTAWVTTKPDGTKVLATNAHVADIYNDAQTPAWGNGRLIAIEPKAPGYRHFVITGIVKHPAYDAWAEWANSVYAKMDAGTMRKVALPIAYDVAYMTVETSADLGEPLKLAPEADMEAMKAGQPLLQIGYPSERVLGTDVARPEPNTNSGVIAAMTSFFLSSGEAVDRQFIQHTAAGAGGSSGSAMFNAKGEVVGLHNSGNYIFIQTGPGDNDYERVPSAGNINYAQRADMLRELMEGKAEERLEKVYKPAWKAAEVLFSKSTDAIVKDQVTWLAADVGGMDKVSVWKEMELEMTSPEALVDGMRGAMAEFDPPVGKVYLFLAQSLDERNIGLAIYVKEDDSFFGVGARGSFFSAYRIWYDGALPIKVVVFDDYGGQTSEDTRPPGKVKLTVYEGPMPTE
ncbi:MAG: FHA domain-containing protein [Micropepsaceae bacterium]